jgi:hypothetical protein
MTHGFLATPVELIPLARWLKDLGFEVSVWGHATLNRSISGHAEKFVHHVQRTIMTILPPHRPSKIHFVGHSMGAIIVRASLPSLSTSPEIPTLGRAVFLAPPNGGTALASKAPAWLRRMIPSIDDLSDDPSSFSRSLPTPPVEFGILRVEKDHLIPRHSSPLAGAKEIADVPGLHTTMLYRKSLAKRVSNFLQNGSFQPLPPIPVSS